MKHYPSRPRLARSLAKRLFSLSGAVRALLVVALLAFVASLPLYVFAENQTAPPQPTAPAIDKSGNHEVFVIYRDNQGESICREATAVEKARLLERDGAGPANTIYAGGRRASEAGGKSLMRTESGTALLPSAGLRIVLHATTQLQNDPVARDAFIVAANRWEALVSTPITVVLDVDYGPTFFGQSWSSPSVLGATGTSNVTMSFPEVRTRLINNAPSAEELQVYNALPAGSVPTELNGATTNESSVRTTYAVGRALGFLPNITNPESLPIGQGDAGIGFNSAHSFDFDPENGITSGLLDFDAVVVHEIGHALGFTSRAGNQLSSPLSMWDLFRFRPGTASLGTFGTAPRVMSEGGEQVFFNNRTNSFGSLELRLSTGGSDGVGGDGEQSSHWKDDRFTAFIGIMDPRLSSGRREVITSNDLSALDSFGYMIGGIAPPPPPPPPTPANDNFSAATALNSSPGSITGTNVGATGETGEPNHAGVSGVGRRSVWYNWTAPATAEVAFDTAGSNYDTVLGVYTGTAVNSLTAIAANDDVQSGVITHSRVTFFANAGTTYRIAIDGFDGDTGNIILNWSVSATFNIAGRMTNVDGSAVSGVQIFLSGFQSLVVTTNSNGDFAFNGLSSGRNYTVAPGFQGGLTTFAPTSYTFDNLQASQTANFVRTVSSTFTVSGRVTSGSGAGVPFIRIEFPGSTTPVGGFPILPIQTDSNGDYSVNLAAGGNYNLTPTSIGYVYTPHSISINNLSANTTANFTAIADTVDLTGRVLENGAGLRDVTVTVYLGSTGVTRSTNTGFDGVYRFEDLPQASFYDIKPRKLSYIFNPRSLRIGSPLEALSDIQGTKVHPIDTSEFFVDQHYLDFLNRQPDDNGFNFWVDNIEGCGSSVDCRGLKRVDTSAAFFLSIEFQETGYLVYRFYKAAFGNIPGAPVPVRLAEFRPDAQQIGYGVWVGLGDWQGILEMNKQAFALNFIARSRFTTAFPNTLSPTQFVNTLFANAGITPTTAERNAAIAEFGTAANTADNMARVRALRRIADNSQLKTLELNKAFVLMQYFGYLQRNPDDAPEPTHDFQGYTFWLNKLNQFNGNFADADMVKAFIVSGEYRARFSQ